MKKIQLQASPSNIKAIPVTKFDPLPETAVPVAPAGPPPPSDNPSDPGYVYPTDAQGFVGLAILVGKGPQTAKAQLWATVAQTLVMVELLKFLRPGEGNEEGEVPSGLSAAIADGILMAQAEAEEERKQK